MEISPPLMQCAQGSLFLHNQFLQFLGGINTSLFRKLRLTTDQFKSFVVIVGFFFFSLGPLLYSPSLNLGQIVTNKPPDIFRSSCGVIYKSWALPHSNIQYLRLLIFTEKSLECSFLVRAFDSLSWFIQFHWEHFIIRTNLPTTQLGRQFGGKPLGQLNIVFTRRPITEIRQSSWIAWFTSP